MFVHVQKHILMIFIITEIPTQILSDRDTTHMLTSKQCFVNSIKLRVCVCVCVWREEVGRECHTFMA